MFILRQTSVKMAVLLHKLGYRRFHSIIAVVWLYWNSWLVRIEVIQGLKQKVVDIIHGYKIIH